MNMTLKDAWINVILKNSVYTPRSKLILDLKKELMKLSASSISNLGLIIEIKLEDNTKENTDENSNSQKKE